VDELTRDEIDDLLRGELVGRIGVHADGKTYVVPVIYAYEGECLYVVSVEGLKVRMMRASPEVCFEVDRYEVATGSWRSAIVDGRYEELEGDGAQHALSLLGARFREVRGDAPAGDRRPRGDGRPTVAFRIRIVSVTGRSVRR
jgi:nitroimidazol reductase NimA-like FMN-containing flavoprotein (pyridoxamine 5'-phosphate oxidase superfamily)